MIGFLFQMNYKYPIQKALYKRSTEDSSLKNVYFPNMYLNTTEFTLKPREKILILLEDKHDAKHLPQHKCHRISGYSNQLGLVAMNNHLTRSIVVHIHEPLSHLLYLSDMSSESVYIKPCLPHLADDNKYYNFNHKEIPFYLDLPRLKLNTYPASISELEDDEGTMIPIKNTRCLSRSNNSYDPNHLRMITPRVIAPKDYFLYEICHTLLVYNCKTDRVAVDPEENLGLIIINKSLKETIVYDQDNPLLTYLYHPDVFHQLIRFKIETHSHHACFIM